MKRAIIAILVLAGLSACAGKPRTEPPAPIEGAGAPKPVLPPTPVKPPAPEPTVETYAYRAPGSAPDPSAPPAEAQPQQASEPAPSMTSLPTETATGQQSTTAPSAAGGAAQTPPPAKQMVASLPSPPPLPTLPPAADALAKQAEQQRKMKDYVGAAATLERALRIQPQEAYLWNRLARVRMEQGLHSQAGNLAARSNALAGDQAQLKQDNWGIIAVSKRASGDAAGATEAEQKARGG
jgi:hypothetical protein